MSDYDLAGVERALASGCQARRLGAVAWHVTSSDPIHRGPYLVLGEAGDLRCTCRAGSCHQNCRHVALIQVLLASGAVPIPGASKPPDVDLRAWAAGMRLREAETAAILDLDYSVEEGRVR